MRLRLPFWVMQGDATQCNFPSRHHKNQSWQRNHHYLSRSRRENFSAGRWKCVHEQKLLPQRLSTNQKRSSKAQAKVCNSIIATMAVNTGNIEDDTNEQSRTLLTPTSKVDANADNQRQSIHQIDPHDWSQEISQHAHDGNTNNARHHNAIPLIPASQEHPCHSPPHKKDTKNQQTKTTIAALESSILSIILRT